MLAAMTTQMMQRAENRSIAAPPAVAVQRKAAEVDPLARFGTVVTLNSGEALFVEGDEAAYYYKVVSGAIRSYTLMPDGRRQIADFFVAGDFFGLTDHAVQSLAAEAITAANLVRYRRHSVDEQAVSQPALARYLLDIACANLAAARHQMVLLGRKTAEERIASFLLTLFERIGRVEREEEIIDLPMSRTDIADHLGLSTETVSRTFTSLARRGLLSLPNAQTVVLCDREALQDIGAGF
ncbi:MAG TPA: helix-turn-helix domain-containing protein [Methyloceanibacter sp.]|nr:helix-turn-helix domain-containing protein [Methyloceanibacter sp.]